MTKRDDILRSLSAATFRRDRERKETEELMAREAAEIGERQLKEDAYNARVNTIFRCLPLGVQHTDGMLQFCEAIIDAIDEGPQI